MSEVGASEWAAMKPGPALAGHLAAVDLAAVPNTEIVDVLQASWRQVSHAYATYLAAVAEVARSAPLRAGGPPVERLAEAGAWAAEEIGAALRFTSRRADLELEFATVLVDRLPRVFAALQSGHLDHHKAKVFADHLADLDDAAVEQICTALVDRAAGLTTGQLAVRILEEIQAIDPGYSRRRLQRAIRRRGVVGYMARNGSVTITAHGLEPTDAAAANERLTDLGEAVLAAGHPGSIDQICADLFVRLMDGSLNGLGREQIVAAMRVPQVDGSAPAGGPPYGIEVRIGLATLLGRDDQSAELPGWGSIHAEDARKLVERQLSAEWRFAITDAEGYLLHAGITRRRPRATNPNTACRGGVVEMHVSAASLAELSEAADLQPGWAAVVADIVQQYASRDERPLDDHPDARFARSALRRHVQVRDRSCVGPGCRRSALKSHQDHTIDHARGGRTVERNLDQLCRRHHAMKHKGGWKLSQPEPGRFRWRSPLGRTYSVRGSPIGTAAGRR